MTTETTQAAPSGTVGAVVGPLPCPFCGEPPKWIEMSGWPGFGIYECVNRECYMVARSVGSQSSLEQWNRRANNRVSGPQPAQETP